jgi:hypothetical protein
MQATEAIRPTQSGQIIAAGSFRRESGLQLDQIARITNLLLRREIFVLQLV